jgi:hypothetical protein
VRSPGTSMLVQVPCCTNFQELPWKSTVEVPRHVVPKPRRTVVLTYRRKPCRHGADERQRGLAEFLAGALAELSQCRRRTENILLLLPSGHFQTVWQKP